MERVNNGSMALNTLPQALSAAVRTAPGVARLGTVPSAQRSRLGAPAGVVVDTGDGVRVDCYIVALAEAQLVVLGLTVQLMVAAIVQRATGTAVREVNVYIQDVEIGRG